MEARVSELDETPKYDGATMYDDPEEWGEHYVFLLTGAPEDSMIRVANDLIQLPGVPVGSLRWSPTLTPQPWEREPG